MRRGMLHPLPLLVTLLGMPAWGLAADWKLVFEDDFEREAPGDAYNLVHGQASIVEGRLQLLGGGATLLIERAFAPDVRLEFDAMAYPEATPCDLSVGLACNPTKGYTYLLAFGGKSNRINHLQGPGIGLVDENPPYAIEHGKTYRMVAQREGRRITYEANGDLLLDGTPEPLLGGPGFDRVGFVTWNGMLIDHVRVYERAEPHPDTPEYLTALPALPLVRDGRTLRPGRGVSEPGLDQALAAFEAGRFEVARKEFAGLDDPLLRLAGLAHLYGDLNYYESEGELAAFAQVWREEAKAFPDDPVIGAFVPAVDRFAALVMDRRAANDAIVLEEIGPANNPFYHKARLYRARYHYWQGREGGSRKKIGEAVAWMAELKQLWPENRVLREYTGEKVPWGEELNADPERHPAWAAYLREAYARQVAILDRWYRLRQRPDGQLGGGWGDDVEILRGWVPVAAISTGAESALAAIERLAEGVWHNATRDGYSPEIGDVEHSAEPSADAFPTMMLLRWGDPLWVERNLRSAKTIRERMMGLDDLGYPRFLSTEIGAEGAARHWRAGGDTGYHVRAMKHFLWLAWQGNAEAREWFVGWADGWRNATMLAFPDKRPGIAPSTIWYPTGTIAPPNGKPWYDETSNYYSAGGLPDKIHDTFLSAYFLAPDLRFLQPFQAVMDLASRPLPDGPAEPGSLAWQVGQADLVADGERAAVYRWLAGEDAYAETVLQRGTPAHRYRIDRDLDRYLETFHRVAKSLRTDLWLQTTEVLSTDRAGLPGAQQVWAAYTGALTSTVDGKCPSPAATYETPDADFAALVVGSSPRRLRVWLYTFWDGPVRIGLRPWLLEPGVYLLHAGEQRPGDGPGHYRCDWSEPRRLPVLHRGEAISVEVPPQAVYIVDLRLERPLEAPERAPDLAIAPRDVAWAENGLGLAVTLHNIGNADAKDVRVALQQRSDEAWQTLAEARVARLPAPENFAPFTETVRLEVPPSAADGALRVLVDPDNALYEQVETNNVAPPPQRGR